MIKTLIVIPARYASTRLPGKPLMKILGKEMLLRVYENALKVSLKFDSCQIMVATEDNRIVDFCREHDVPCQLTSDQCKTGTDRVMEVIHSLPEKPAFVVNLQGDNPLCPPWFVQAVVNAYYENPSVQVVTPFIQLSWDELDQLRLNKQTTPFSGTTIVMDQEQNAYYFSKNIIPAIRKEAQLKQEHDLSPVCRHIGLYGYQTDVLERFVTLPEGVYEKLEGLEQLRFIENGFQVKCVPVSYGKYQAMSALSGVDNPEDIERVEKVLEEYGEF